MAVAAIAFLGVSLAAPAAACAVDTVAPPARVFHEGNATACSGGKHSAGLSGVIISPPGTGATGTVSPNGKELTVTITDGFTASGIVVKGGDNFNVYVGPFVGPTTIGPMISPPVGQGNTPAISHWFVCGGASTSIPGTASITSLVHLDGTHAVIDNAHPATAPASVHDLVHLTVSGVAVWSGTIDVELLRQQHLRRRRRGH